MDSIKELKFKCFKCKNTFNPNEKVYRIIPGGVICEDCDKDILKDIGMELDFDPDEAA